MKNKFTYQLDFDSLKGVKGIFVDDKIPGTGVVRLGDVELDGYPDLVITVVDSSDKPRSIFFNNKECDSNFIALLNTTGRYTDGGLCRRFVRYTNMDIIESNAVQVVAFFDYHEIGYDQNNKKYFQFNDC